jgi:hypothetical protein
VALVQHLSVLVFFRMPSHRFLLRLVGFFFFFDFSGRANQNRSAPLLLAVFRLTLSDLFFETRADPQVCGGGVLSFLTLRSSWPEFYFVFLFFPPTFYFFLFVEVLARRLHADSRNSFLTVQTGQDYIGFDGFNFLGLITPNDWKST